MNFCPQCGASLSAHARFCHSCGRPLAGGGRGVRLAWYFAGGAVLLLVAVLAFQALTRESQPRAAAPFAQGTASGAGRGAPPDLSTMSPRQAADRLFDRVMNADELGDNATVAQFTPMALQAYRMIGPPDIDARLHIALLQLTTGNPELALAQADSVAAEAEGHLFVPIIRARAFEHLGRTDDRLAAYRAFLTAEERERATQRIEYQEHARLLDLFREQALAATSNG